MSEIKTTAKNAASTASTEIFPGADVLKSGFDKTAKMFETAAEFGKGNIDALVESATITGGGLQTIEHYVAHQGGMQVQLAHARRDGLKLANRNLEKLDLTGASLVDASLYGSDLHRVGLYRADLRDCDLR